MDSGGGGGGAKASDGRAHSAAFAESAAARDVAAVARRRVRDNLSLALKWLDIFVPQAKLNIAFCLLGNAFRAEAAAARRQRDAELAAALVRAGCGGGSGGGGHGVDDDDHDEMKISVSVEALGSGQVLVPDITLSRRATLLDLKKRIAAYAASKEDPKKKEKGGGGGDAVAAVSVGAMRLFHGHGGPELKVDTHTLLMGAVTDGAVLVLAMAMDDVTALTALFYVTGGTSWNRSNRKHWRNPNKHHSRWSGVLCPPRQHVDHDRVLRLTLNNAGLNGPIPAVIGQLDQLTHLCMRGNRLTGPIPTEIGLLTNLQGRGWDIALDLAENQLSGPVPTEISKLTKLRSWDLRGNASLHGDGGLGKKFS